jgi:type I restriction enzyme S subunit
LYDIGSGISITPDKYGYGYPFLTFKDIFNSPYIKNEIETLVDSTERDRKNSSICEGDVFLTRTSETAEELGMSTVALKDYPNATFNGFSKRLRPKCKKIDPLYAAYYFRTQYFRNQTYAMASIITRASLNNTNISHLKIRYPESIEVQHKIGEYLHNYDSLIENNNNRINLLEQMAENLYKEWFLRFRFSGHKKTEFEYGIPIGWNVVKVKTLVSRLPFGVLYKTEDTEKEGNVIVIDQSKSSYVGFHNEEPSHMASIDYPIALFGDHSCKFKLMIRPFSLSENVIPYIATDSNSTIFLHYSLLRLIETTEYKRHWSELLSKKILVPPKTIQDKFDMNIQHFLLQIELLYDQNRNLMKQRDLLLPRLMSGKFEVK